MTPAATPDSGPPAAASRRWPRALAWSAATLAALALLWTLAVGQWLPGFLKPRIEAAGSVALGTPVVLERLTIDPWKLVVQLDGLRLGAADAPLATLASARTTLSLQSLRQRAPVLAELRLEAPVLQVERSADGRFNFSPMLDHLRARQAAQPPDPTAAPARFALHNIRLEGGAIHYRDAQLRTEHHVEALRLGLPFLSNLPADIATEVQPLLEARVDGSALRLDGHARPFAPERPAELALQWQGVRLADWAGLLQALLPPDLAPQALQGEVDAGLTFAFEARPAPQPPSLHVRGRLMLREVGLALPAQGLDVAWRGLALEELDLAPLDGRHALARIAFDGLQLGLTRPARRAAASAAGDAPAAAIRGGAAASGPPAGASAPEAAAVSPVQWQIGELRCTDCALRYTDAAMAPPVRIELADLQLGLQRLASPPAGPIAFELAAQVAAAAGDAKPAPGQVRLVGEADGLGPLLAPAASAKEAAPADAPLSVQAEVGLDALDLRALQPYLAPHLDLTLASARVGTTGTLTLSAPPGALRQPAELGRTLKAGYRGSARIDGLATRDSVTGADVIGWRQLAFDGLAFGWQGGAGPLVEQVDADLGRVRLDGLQARVILYPDAHLNLADIVRREAGAAPRSITTPAGAAPAPMPAAHSVPVPGATPAASAPAAAPLKLRWQAIVLNDGTVQFTDQFVRPNYSARLTRLAGEVSALWSGAPEPARVSLRGALDDGAPLAIAGRVHPFGARVYTDIEASARGIALTRLSTYAERYAGHAIEKGSLSVNVSYRIEQGRLEAQNQVFLDQLTFGRAVDSPDALKLPVRLAVALLKNGRGEIDVRLPVSGTLDDPQFSIGGVLWRVAVNLLTRIVTAPFAALFGSDSNEASHLAFAPGSAEIDDAGRARLDALAARLADKPGLKLEASGRADPQADAAALQAEYARAELARRAQAAAGATAASAPPQSASPTPALDAAALEVELLALADRRADGVQAYLAARLPAERVLVARSQVGTERPEGDTGPASRVQFDLR